ncbi:hypothetical protein HPB50_022834 [Hyalomma asiaticum]|uniref:Uncharacterized protein n=1 Tax=Hyalomma asiaticum TaxID=266040 RepID=A0ACB7SZ32_HYAAI|nr:hypothetical protein HPB50_022834 [Hyalomma asiaticum]
MCSEWRLTELKANLQEFNPRDIYSINERAFYRLFPQNLHAFTGDDITGGKHSKFLPTNTTAKL